MWILKWIILAIFVIVIIGFAMQNTMQNVSVNFIQWQSIDLPLWVIMYGAFAAGICFWLFVSIFHVLKLKSENRKCKKEIKKLENELNRLRNVSVEESILPIEEKLLVEKNTPEKDGE